MQTVCPECKSLNPLSSKFCGECGASLESARIAQEVTSQPEGAAHELQEEEAEPGGPPRGPTGKTTPMRMVLGAAIPSALVAGLLSYTLAPILFIESMELLASMAGAGSQGVGSYEDYVSLTCGLVGVGALIMAVFGFPFCYGGARLGYARERRFRGERASGLSALPGALLGGIVAFVLGIVLLFYIYFFGQLGG